jgi:hypothetical protein
MPRGAFDGDTIHIIAYLLLHYPLMGFCVFIRSRFLKYFISEELKAEVASEASTDEKGPLLKGAYCFQNDKERQGHSEWLAYQKRSFYGLRPQHLSIAAALMHALLYGITLWIIMV